MTESSIESQKMKSLILNFSKSILSINWDRVSTQNFSRLVTTGGGWRGLISSLRVQNGGLPVILWLLGTITSVLTIRFDESLAPSVVRIKQSFSN